MLLKKIIILFFFGFIYVGCAMVQKDTFVWLEDIESKKSLDWVDKQNLISENWFKSKSDYLEKKSHALKILESKDRILNITVYDQKYVYNFWKDEINVKGILRRSNYKKFISGKPNWETILDIDQLSKVENENWVFKGQTVLESSNDKSLIYLSRGGKDASVVREFDLIKKTFVKDGFFIPEAKTNVSWVNENNILVGTDFGPGSMTKSGYPRVVKILSRGQKISEAKVLFEGNDTDMAIHTYSKKLNDGSIMNLISRSLDFYTSEQYFLNSNLKLIKLSIPNSFDVMNLVEKKYLAKARKDIAVKGLEIKSGSLVSFAFDQKTGNILNLKIIFKPTENQSLNSIHVTKNYVILNTLEDVKSKLYYAKINHNDNELLDLKPLFKDSINTYNVEASSSDFDDIFYVSEGFLHPSKLNWLNLDSMNNKVVQSKKRNFDSSTLEVHQEWALSSDGTRIPYFIVHKKNLKKNGSNKTLLYGYGGFEVSLEPHYLNSIGKLWLEDGGVYVLANIRGGGEFGPRWHQAALKENRHKAFEDFIAVAEDLVERKITSPKKLAIQGGSNGGLLVGSVMVKRPELFGAVVCLVPLLDMLNYHKLLAGASWIAEYGNPDNSKERKYLQTYSPYQNLDLKQKYPPIFLYTSTKDDRVHPGHARKMAAKLMSLNADILYFENMEGGHAGSTNFEQQSRLQAMIYTFLDSKLD